MRLFVTAFVLVVCLVASVARAGALADFTDRLKLSGWVEGIQSVGVHAPNEEVTSRARLRLNLEGDFDWVYGWISADLEKNCKLESETGADIHEFWLEHVGEGWDMRVGRQTIIWGRADGVQITDIICPPDYTESITRDLDEIRMPVDAAKFRLLGSSVDTELIWIPVFRAAKLPKDGNPWASSASWPAGIDVHQEDEDKPDVSLKNSELGLRVSAYFSGFDFSASVFHGWDDMAAYHRYAVSSGGSTDVYISPKHHRLTVLGLDFARPWSDFVFRGEAACYLGRYFATDALEGGVLQRDAVKWLAGVDWTPGNDWTVIAQIYGQRILDYDNTLSEHRHNVTTTLNISKELLNQTLTLSSMLYLNLNDLDSFYRAKADYEVSDGFHVILGADLFGGTRSGSYGQYQNNSQIWLKTKYSF